MKIILGSKSPRRKEILSFFSIPFEQSDPVFDEDNMPFHGNPERYVCSLSEGKARSLVSRYPNEIILTADTIVYRGDKIYGKPRTEQEAFETLSELVGKWHTVYTGVTVLKEGAVYSQTEATSVLFNNLTSEQVRHYIQHTQWSDKAGGYAIQSASGLIVRKIDGCYYNVMGLPINTVEMLLKKVGIELWDFI